MSALAPRGGHSFIYGQCELTIEQISSGGTVTYLHHDQQGSTRLLTGSTGTVTGSTTFDAYGNKTGSTGTSTTPLGYDAQYTSSDTGLIYLRARTYNPSTAQFLSVDPLAGVTRAPYTYAGDNPLNASDPTGLISLEEIGEGIAGWGDTITFGATEWVREELGNNNINPCSSAYQAGGYAGLATAALIPGEGEAELGAEGASLELSQHAIQRMAERGIGADQVENVVRDGESFNYYHGGTWKKGYYDPATRVFVGSANGTITTVITDASQQYIQNLQGVQP